MLKLRNVHMNVEYSTTYGNKSVVTGEIVNVGILPKAYYLVCYFYKNDTLEYKLGKRGICLRKTDFAIEAPIDADKADVILTGVLGFRKYDQKELHPA